MTRGASVRTVDALAGAEASDAQARDRLALEHAALTCAAGLVDRSTTGVLRFDGADALDLLNRLSTNQLDGLAVGSAARTVVTTNKGRIVDVLTVMRLDSHLLVETSPGALQRVAEHVEFFTFDEDVKATDLTGAVAVLGLVGPDAGLALSAAVGEAAPPLEPLEAVEVSLLGHPVTLLRSSVGEVPAYDVVVPSAASQALWRALLDAGDPGAVTPVGAAALEALRVEQGVPACGGELGEQYNPLEAGLLDCISFSKGCYVGQEVVARLNTYDRVQRRLVGLTWDAPEAPQRGTALYAGGQRAGAVTSVAWSPLMQRHVGLGYVRKAHARAGVSLALGSPDGVRAATVTELPFRP